MSYSLRTPGFVAAAALAGLMAGCGVPAKMAPQALRTPGDLGAAVLAGSAAEFPADDWWKAYGDPALDALIAEGLASSPDVALAAARIRAADAAVGQAGGALAPEVSAEGSVGGQKQSYNLGFPKQFVPKGVKSTGKLSLMLGFDLDLWGKNRALLAAARGEATAARVDAAQAQLLLSSAIALQWGQLAALEASRAEAARSLDALLGVERLTAQRQQAGLDNKADVALSTGRRAGAEQALAALDEQIALQRNAIAALVGAGPDRAKSLPHPALDLSAAMPMPANLALDLVGRRPDLVSARLRVEAASSRVEAARRAYYPDINLAAVVGLQSIGISNLVEGDSTYAQFGPALSLPLFEGGRLHGNYENAGAGYDQAVAQYDKTLVEAVHQIADALDSRRALEARLAAARSGTAAAEDAARLARLRRGEGLANLLQVLAAEDAAAEARRSLRELEARAFLLDVTLVRAIGGGFAAPASGTEPSQP